MAGSRNLFDPFLIACKDAGLPVPVKEFKFCPTRKFRADYAWEAFMLLLEVNGGAYINGRHTRGLGFERDCERRCIAVALGYSILEVTPKQMRNGLALQWAQEAINVRTLP